MTSYIDVGALARIAATSLVAVVAVALAFTAIVAGLDTAGGIGLQRHRRPGQLALIGGGALVCLAAFVLGIYAMTQK